MTTHDRFTNDVMRVLWELSLDSAAVGDIADREALNSLVGIAAAHLGLLMLERAREIDKEVHG